MQLILNQMKLDLSPIELSKIRVVFPNILLKEFPFMSFCKEIKLILKTKT